MAARAAPSDEATPTAGSTGPEPMESAGQSEVIVAGPGAVGGQPPVAAADGRSATERRFGSWLAVTSPTVIDPGSRFEMTIDPPGGAVGEGLVVGIWPMGGAFDESVLPSQCHHFEQFADGVRQPFVECLFQSWTPLRVAVIAPAAAGPFEIRYKRFPRPWERAKIIVVSDQLTVASS